MIRGSILRVVVVGAGLMGRWHGRAAKRAGAQVVGVVDPDEVRAKKLARRLGAPHTASNLSDLLRSVPADVTHVCTPLETHTSLIREAMEEGCHVLVEKPITESFGEAEALLAQAKELDRILCPTHQFLFQRGVLRLSDRRRDMGVLRHMRLTACSAGATDAAEAETDRIALEILPHFLSLAVRFGFSSSRSVRWSTVRSGPGELQLIGRQGSTLCSALVSMSGRPTRNELEWIATRGSAHLDLFHGFATLEWGRPTRIRKVIRPFQRSSRTLLTAATNLVHRTVRREPAYPGLGELVRRFYLSIGEGHVPPISPSEILDTCHSWDVIRDQLRRDQET